MALYCSKEIFEALDGVHFPADKDYLIDFAEMKDAREAVIVVLNRLDEKVYRDISEVCENARIACNYDIATALVRAPFPMRREELIEWTKRPDIPSTVQDAVAALPSGYTFSSADEVCEYVL